MPALATSGSLTQTIAPTIDPVALADMKAHLRVDHTDDDALILDAITSATNQCESFTGRQLIRATYTLKFDRFPDEMELPKPPLSSVTSITYVDTAGSSQTIDSADYQVDTAAVIARIRPAWNKSWPAPRIGQYNVVTVTFVTGYGTTVASVPIRLRKGIMAYAAMLYEFREPVAVAASRIDVPEVCRALWYPFRVRVP